MSSLLAGPSLMASPQTPGGSAEERKELKKLLPVSIVAEEEGGKAEKAQLHLRAVLTAPSTKPDLTIRLTRESDPRWLWSLRLGEAEFRRLAAEQQLTVDLRGFLAVLGSLLEDVAEASQKTLVLRLSSPAEARLEVAELNRFRRLCHLSLPFHKASEEELVRYLAAAVAGYKRRYAESREASQRLGSRLDESRETQGAQIRRLTTDVEELRARLEESERERTETEARLAEFEEANSELRRETERLTEEVESWEEAAAELEGRVAEARRSEASLRREVREASASADEAQRGWRAAEARAEEAAQHLRAMLAKRDAYKAQIKEAAEALEREKRSSEARLAEERRRGDQLERENREKLAEIEQLASLSGRLSEQVAELEGAAVAKSQSMAMLSQRMGAMAHPGLGQTFTPVLGLGSGLASRLPNSPPTLLPNPRLPHSTPLAQRNASSLPQRPAHTLVERNLPK